MAKNRFRRWGMHALQSNFLGKNPVASETTDVFSGVKKDLPAGELTKKSEKRVTGRF